MLVEGTCYLGRPMWTFAKIPTKKIDTTAQKMTFFMEDFSPDFVTFTEESSMEHNESSLILEKLFYKLSFMKLIKMS